MRVDRKVVFVTGGGAGSGLDAAQRLHALGGDVTDRRQLDVAVARAIGTYGRIDVVIANAGVAPPVESVRTGSEAAFDKPRSIVCSTSTCTAW